MEDKRGFSLRQKKSSGRPPISAPKQITSQVKTAPPNSQAPRVNGLPEKTPNTRKERPGRPGGNTADLVKRRYSTRFAQLPDFSHADAPPLPNGPSFAKQQIKGLQASGQTQDISVDIGALRDPHLDAEKYTTNVLSDASDQQLRDFQTNLRKLKNRTSTDLQQNVYQNRTQFIKISKEAEKLKGEMRTLRGLMSELTTFLSNASSGLPVPEPRASFDNVATKTRKQANRSSVADLEAMRNVQLHALWKNVEGSQKYLPAISGRHIVHEQGHWVQLDAATWKPRRPVHIFLLNDHLMVAAKKKKRVDPAASVNGEPPPKQPTRLIADKCWPLQDIEMSELSSNPGAGQSKGITNAVTIRCGSESFTYRSERDISTEKNNLLMSFRRAADELRRTLQADTENNSARTKETMNFYATRDPALSDKTDLLRSLSNSKERPEILVDVDGKQKNLRWVEGQIDELDIEVALQRFEDAVRHVEKLRRLNRGLKSNLIAHELITTKVDERAQKLADLVVVRLIDTHSYSNATQTNIAWLVRLGFDDRARESFLMARSGIITRRARQCVFEGDLHHYIFQVSYVYFTLIKNTVSIYQQCFPPLMTSACVSWAKAQLDNFNVILSRQLSSVKKGGQTWNECMELAKEHAMMMNEVGLDFKELVNVEQEDEG